MNITKESAGELEAIIKIEIKSEDYEEKVAKTLKDLQKKANLKGFRPGKVPFGLVKKLYGKDALAEEINNLLSESLNNFIIENKLNILGYPLANEQKNKKADFENDTRFEFWFDIGLATEFNIELNENTVVDFYQIRADDKIVDHYVKNLQNRYGEPFNPDNAESGDLIKVDIIQLDSDGNYVENGVRRYTSLSIDFIKDEKVREEFVGKKIGEIIRFNPLKATENEYETASMLGIKKDERSKLEADYEMTITEISRIKPADLNKELYQIVYPNDNIETEEQLREKLRDEANSYYQSESDGYFVHEVFEKLLHDTKIDLPDGFVKRWLVNSEGLISQENIDKDYEKYARSLRHQLLIKKITQDNGIKVETEDIKNQIWGYFTKQYRTEDESMIRNLESIVDLVMKNQEEVNKIHDHLFDEKLKEVFKAKLKKNIIEISYDDFIKTVNEHHKHHHHEHE
jgi:trigger factor